MDKFIDLQDIYDEEERKDWKCDPLGCRHCEAYDDCLQNCQDSWIDDGMMEYEYEYDEMDYSDNYCGL